MKREFLSIIVAVFALASFSARAEKVGIKLKGDTAQIVAGHDTVSVSSNVLKSIASRIDSRLNDTLLSNGEVVISDDDLGAADSDEMSANELELEKERLLYEKSRLSSIRRTITVVGGLIQVGVVLIVMMSLITYYMHRRAKYRVIEKAIENNYKLPDGIFGDRVIVQQKTVYMPDAQAQNPQNQNAQQADAQPQMPVQQPQQYAGGNYGLTMDSFMALLKWNRSARVGLRLIIIGLCAMIFFISVGAGEMAGACCIFLLLGAWRLVVAYYDNRNTKCYTMGSEPQQSQPSQAQQSAQPTPPPFSPASEDNDNNNSGEDKE